jgi:hypothetical protein
MSARLTLCALIVIASISVGATTAGASPSPFTGAWQSVDPDDGSPLMAMISAPNAAGVIHLTFIDQYATACGAPATAIGSGTITGSRFTAVVRVRCGGAPVVSGVEFWFDLTGDTLVSSGLVYTRVGSGS